jgi:hypothetical protein
MRDRVTIWLGLTLLLFATLACNAFAGREELGLPPPPNPTATPGLGASGTPGASGLAPTATLPGDPTALPAQGTLRILVDLNVRGGPGVSHPRVGFLLRDERVTVVGRDEASGWWRIQCPPRAEGNECWVSGGTQYTRLETALTTPTP